MEDEQVFQQPSRPEYSGKFARPPPSRRKSEPAVSPRFARHARGSAKRAVRVSREATFVPPPIPDAPGPYLLDQGARPALEPHRRALSMREPSPPHHHHPPHAHQRAASLLSSASFESRNAGDAGKSEAEQRREQLRDKVSGFRNWTLQRPERPTDFLLLRSNSVNSEIQWQDVERASQAQHEAEEQMARRRQSLGRLRQSRMKSEGDLMDLLDNMGEQLESVRSQFAHLDRPLAAST